MSNKPFPLEQLFGGFCPPSTVEDSDDEEPNIHKLHSGDLHSGVTNDKQTNPPTRTTPPVDSTLDETSGDWDKVFKTSRRRILPARITTKSPTVKKDVPHLAETPSSALETDETPGPIEEKEILETKSTPSSADEIPEGERALVVSDTPNEVCETESVPSLAVEADVVPALSSEKELSEIKNGDSLKSVNGNFSDETANHDFAVSPEAICKSVPVPPLKDTANDDTPDQVARSSQNSMFFQYVLIMCAFALYFYVNFNRADIFSMQRSLRDREAIKNDRILSSMATDDSIEPVPDKASDNMMGTPQNKEEAGGQGEISPEDREAEYDRVESSTSRGESPTMDLECDEEPSGGAEDRSISSSQEQSIHTDTIVEQGGNMNSGLEYLEEVDRNVERDAETEDWVSDPEMQTVTTYEESEGESNSDPGYETQVNGSAHGFANNEPEHGEQEDGIIDDYPAEQSEANFDHDAATRDTGLGIGHEDQMGTMVEHDSDSNLDHQGEIDISRKDDSEDEVRSWNPVHEDQVENMIEPEAEMFNGGSVHEHEGQSETAAKSDVGIEDLEPDIVEEEQAESITEPEAAIRGQPEMSVENDAEFEDLQSDLEYEESENFVTAEAAIDSPDSDLGLGGQPEMSSENDGEIEDVKSDLEHEAQAENPIQPEAEISNADLNLEQKGQPEMTVERNVRSDGIQSDFEYEQSENFSKGETELEMIDSDLEYGGQPEMSVEEEPEVEGVDSNLEHEDQMDRIVEQDVESASVPSDLHNWEETNTNNDARVGQEDFYVKDVVLDGEPAMMEENDSAETSMPETMGEDSELERMQEDESIPDEVDLAHSGHSSAMADGRDLGTDAVDENEDSDTQERNPELDSLEDIQHSDVVEAVVTASDDVNQGAHVDVEQETVAIIYPGEGRESGKAEAQNAVPESSTMRFFKLRSDELGLYLEQVEYIKQEALP